MIQLANDPNAARLSWRPNAQGDRQADPQRSRRPGHAWPFLSPHAQRGDRPADNRNPSNDSGS
ncbi:hypothetical protein [Ramlibacter algicola]|jgi:hypothetical protein|uniref:Uncharacterized protein n=1 Tax=Ramlibacter algicola TaxID=2795217 RepID=A0A934PZH1_9BURK|nr:hypothetical protein [Ramlibacter algicola]MBK0391514.1 hypothetical protein [Ramlibacter algicola]